MRKPGKKVLIEVEIKAVHVFATETVIDFIVGESVPDTPPRAEFSIEERRLDRVEHKCP